METEIDIEGFEALLPELSRQIDRSSLRRVFENYPLPMSKAIWKQISGPLNRETLRYVDFEALSVYLEEVRTCLQGKMEERNPAIAIYLYLMGLVEYGGCLDLSWVRDRIRSHAKAIDFDLALIQGCFRDSAEPAYQHEPNKTE